MIDPPRWKFEEPEEEAKEGPDENLHAIAFSQYLFSLLACALLAFSLGTILGSFCMGIYFSIKWIME